MEQKASQDRPFAGAGTNGVWRILVTRVGLAMTRSHRITATPTAISAVGGSGGVEPREFGSITVEPRCSTIPTAPGRAANSLGSVISVHRQALSDDLGPRTFTLRHTGCRPAGAAPDPPHRPDGPGSPTWRIGPDEWSAGPVRRPAHTHPRRWPRPAQRHRFLP